MSSAKILIVEDNPIVAEDIKMKLGHMGYHVTAIAGNGKEALAAVAAERPDIALMDIQIGEGMNGIDTAGCLKEDYQVSVIYLTAFADEETVNRAKRTEPYGYLVKPFDETELKSALEVALYKQQADRRVQESRQWLETTLNSIGDGVIATDADGRVSFMNPVAENLTGWSEVEATDRPLSEVFAIINEGTRQPVENPAARVLSEGIVVGLANHTLLIHRSGIETPIADSAAPIRDHDGILIGVVLVFRDQTEERRTLAALKESEARYSGVVEDTPILICCFEPDGTISFANKAYCDYFTTDAKTLIGSKFQTLIPRQDRDTVMANIQSLSQDTPSMTHEHQVFAPGGDIRWQQWTNRAILNAEGRVASYQAIGEDITKRKQAEEILLLQQEAILLNNRIASVFLTSEPKEIYADVLDVILETLDSSFGYFGYIDDAGNLVCPSMTRHVWDKCRMDDASKHIVFPPSVWGGIWGQSLKKKLTIKSNHGLHLPEGHVPLENALAVPILHHDTLIGQLVVANKSEGYSDRDQHLLENVASQTAPILQGILDDERRKIEKEQLEDQLMRTQKMESIGTLAGGIAHDFNNILSSIIGFSELALDDIEKGSIVEDHLQEIYAAGRRAKDLVKQILTFARQSTDRLKPVRVALIAKEVLKFIRSSIPSTIEIRHDLDSQSLTLGNPTQIHQIMMNLCTNAAQAMEDNGGIMDVRIQDIAITDNHPIVALGLAVGDYIQIRVSDTGTGIPKELFDTIFDPYFSTKGPGDGTGMGLAVVHGIVESYGGKITVDSRPGEHTEFNVYLPITEKQEELQPYQFESLPCGTERILFVDDEAPIAKISARMMASLGYAVTTTTSSQDALERFQSDPHAFDLVITDMTMPDLTGDRLAKAVLAIRGDIPVILCTGYSKKISEKAAREIGIRAFMYKPIVKADLARTIRNVLDDDSCR